MADIKDFDVVRFQDIPEAEKLKSSLLLLTSIDDVCGLITLRRLIDAMNIDNNDKDGNFFYNANQINKMVEDLVKDLTEFNNTNTNNNEIINNSITNLNNYISTVNSTLTKQITDHMKDTSNPHSVTKTQVGLGNVDNTSDKNKPISDATMDALKSNIDYIAAGTNGTIVYSKYGDDTNNNVTVYTHPATHPATMITTDATHRFVTETQMANWDNKANANHSHAGVYADAVHTHPYLPLIGGTVTGDINMQYSNLYLYGKREREGDTDYWYGGEAFATCINFMRINSNYDDLGYMGWSYSGNSLYIEASHELYMHGDQVKMENEKGVEVCWSNGNNWVPLYKSEADDGNASLGSDDHRWTNVWITGTVHSSSDKRCKRDINYLKDNTDKSYKKIIDMLNACTFIMTNNSTNKLRAGYIAQDIEEILNTLNIDVEDFPPLIKTPVYEKYLDEGREKPDTSSRIIDYDYSIAYTEIIPYITEYLQEFYKEHSDLKEEFKKYKEETDKKLEDIMKVLENLK